MTVLGDTSATEMDATNAPGSYMFDLTQAETNADCAHFTGKSSTSNIRIVPQTIYTLPASFTAFVTPPTANENADALLDRADGVETGVTVRQAQRVQLAGIAGKADGLAGTTVHYRNQADTKNRITATVDSSGNRTAVTLDAT